MTEKTGSSVVRALSDRSKTDSDREEKEVRREHLYRHTCCDGQKLAEEDG